MITIPESVITIPGMGDRNPGIGDHLRPESVITMLRNTHFATFPPNAIAEWVDEIKGVGQTALCPWCSIDSVMGDRSGYPITAAFLKSMNAFWF